MPIMIKNHSTDEDKKYFRRVLEAEVSALPKEALKGLSYFGYSAKTKTFNLDNFPPMELSEARMQIGIYLKRKSKTIYRDIHSYGFKHICEDIFRNWEIAYVDYVSNGTFILAMLLEGFKVERIPGTPNAYFNVCKADAKKFSEAAGHIFLG